MPDRTTDAAASEPPDRTPGPEAPTDAPDPAQSASEPGSVTPQTAPGPAAPETAPGAGSSEPATPASQMPEYKGEPLDAERGPGLGCFWIQVALLTFFLIFTPLTVTWGWDPFISGTLLIVTLVLLLFSGQTVIFLLRLVAADRRARRAPLSPTAKPTVGQMEDAGATTAPAKTETPTDVEAPVASPPAENEPPDEPPGEGPQERGRG